MCALLLLNAAIAPFATVAEYNPSAAAALLFESKVQVASTEIVRVSVIDTSSASASLYGVSSAVSNSISPLPSAPFDKVMTLVSLL